MVIENGPQSTSPSRVRAVKEKKPSRAKRPPIQYISKHFASEDILAAERKPRTRQRTKQGVRNGIKSEAPPSQVSSPPATPAKPSPRIHYGLNIDDLSSDSSLTDVPDDIGPDPFSPPLTTTKAIAVKTPRKPKPRHHPTQSPYFPTPHTHRPRPHFLSLLPFPPLHHPTFGLMQERLHLKPFHLLLATIFLNKTPGERAMPVLYTLLSQYPTPTALADADVSTISGVIHHLGFQNQRARKIVALAQGWVDRPPERGVRFAKRDYPRKLDGRDIVPVGESVGDEDERVAWEISHLPGLGPYSHDSWRMFCRDILRGVATGYNGEGAQRPQQRPQRGQGQGHGQGQAKGEVGTETEHKTEDESAEIEFEPEWKRVLPKDKELRAWMAWMWLKEGWVWDCETGQKTRAGQELMALARGGGVVVEEHDGVGGERLRLEEGHGKAVVGGGLGRGGSGAGGAGGGMTRPAGEVLDDVKAEAR